MLRIPLRLAASLAVVATCRSARLSAVEADPRGPVGYIAELPSEDDAARSRRHARVAERRKGTPVLVHRGASRFAPENSLEAYKAAMDRGADGVEIDIRRSADGVLYLLHDDTLERTTEGSGPAKGLAYPDLLRSRLKGSDARIPTLAAVLHLARQRAMLLHLDVKEAGLQADIERMLDAADAWDHVVEVNAGNAERLRAHPKVRLLVYKGWLPDGDDEAVRRFLASDGDMVFVKSDPSRAVRALGRDPAERPVPLPDWIEAAWTARGPVPRPFREIRLPVIDLAGEEGRRTTVDREDGQYLGHPTTVLLEDGRTILCVYPKGHGRGAIAMKRSLDGGLTWSERLPVPASWATSLETPTIHRLVAPDGSRNLVVFSGLHPIRRSISRDDGTTWTELEPIGDFGGIVAMSSVVLLADGRYMALFHDDGRFLEREPRRESPPVFRTYRTDSSDGGVTWGPPRRILESVETHLCEPGAVRSPDGRTIALLLRENRRVLNSFVVFSSDEGETWTAPRELPGTLTGDRHVGRYAPDGRLLITFRDMAHGSRTRGDWVAWVGTWEDIALGREGQHRVRLMDNRVDADCGYPGLELLPDGTLVAMTYGHWSDGAPPWIVSVRVRLPDLDGMAGFPPRASDPRRVTSWMPARDGTRLATDIYLPEGDAPRAAVLTRTPYGRHQFANHSARIVARGLASVVQDCRGRFGSEGLSDIFLTDGWGELQDGHDAVEWVASQRWCDGRVATTGASAMGITQYLAAGAAPPHLVCCDVAVACGSLYHHAAYPGGAFGHALVVDWLTGNRFPPEVLERVRRQRLYAEPWTHANLAEAASRVSVPMRHYGGWFDVFLQGTIDAFVALQHEGGPGARGKQRLIIGPWTHGGKPEGELTFPPSASESPPEPSGGQWIEAWLGGRGEELLRRTPAVQYYTMGACGEPGAPGNEWRSAPDWPVPTSERPWFLHPGGKLASAPADASATIGYRYDPDDPVPTRGGCNLAISRGTMDQREVEGRPDVLVFTSDPLEEPLEVTGRVRARLHVSSSAPDTDFTAKLTDVYPDGRSMLVCDGILRARHRESLSEAKLLEPGQVEPITVDLWSTSIVFNRGHRIRLAVSSSNAPRFEPNPNTAGGPGSGEPARTADNAVHLGPERPSALLLPVAGD